MYTKALKPKSGSKVLVILDNENNLAFATYNNDTLLLDESKRYISLSSVVGWFYTDEVKKALQIC